MAKPGRKEQERYVSRIENEFILHSLDKSQRDKCNFIRGEALALAKSVAEACPASEERDAAIGLLREVVMWASAAIACHVDV